MSGALSSAEWTGCTRRRARASLHEPGAGADRQETERWDGMATTPMNHDWLGMAHKVTGTDRGTDGQRRRVADW